MRRRIYTDVPASRSSILEQAIAIDGGSFTKAEQANGNFTLVAEFPGEEILPPTGTSTPWMKIAEQEKDAGVKEEPGSNPRIEEYFESTTYGRHPDTDLWCSAFVNFCVTEAGVKGTNNALARSWLGWGDDPQQFTPGCIVVLARGSAGHGHSVSLSGPTPMAR